MSTHSGAVCNNMYGNIIIYQGEGSSKGRKRSHQEALQKPENNSTNHAKKPKKEKQTKKDPTAPRICYWQDSCNRQSCRFEHLPQEFLADKRKPYSLCYYYPKCTRDPCPFVHWDKDTSRSGREDDQQPSSYTLPGSKLPTLTFTSKGGRRDGQSDMESDSETAS